MERLLLLKGFNNFIGITFPLGLMYLSSSLKRRYPDVEVRLVDLRLSNQDYHTLEETVRVFRPTVVGLSFLSAEMGSVDRILEIVKSADPSTPVIAGGPHSSSDPEGTLKRFPRIDFVAVGEGEEIFSEWFGALREGRREFESIQGLVRRKDDGGIFVNPPRSHLRELDDLPSPDYSLVRMEGPNAMRPSNSCWTISGVW